MYELSMWKTGADRTKCCSCQEDTAGVGKDSKSSDRVFMIELDPAREFQEIAGFGGAYNEVGWEAVSCLSREEQAKVFDALFGGGGCRFNLCRTPIGASDFALDDYSLNDVNGDFAMEHFNISRDRKRLIPYISRSMGINPSLKVWGCPWSPPYWMKTSGDMCNGGELLDTPENLRAYAAYFKKYIEEYEKEGVPLLAVCIQNETDVVNIYPTSTMPPELMKKFIRAYLIPELVRFQGKPLKTGIWAGSIRNVMGYAHEVASDPVIKQFVKGIGYQYSSPEVVWDSYEKYPGIKLYHTESPCHNGANSWEEAKEIYLDIVSYLESGCVNYSYWNMILDESALSSWGWKQNSMLTIDRTTKEVLYNYEYYVMMHFSHYIEPGAKRISSSGSVDGSMIAFKNPDRSIILLVSNFSDEKRTADISLEQENFKVALEPSSIYTLRFSRV